MFSSAFRAILFERVIYFNIRKLHPTKKENIDKENSRKTTNLSVFPKLCRLIIQIPTIRVKGQTAKKCLKTVRQWVRYLGPCNPSSLEQCPFWQDILIHYVFSSLIKKPHFCLAPFLSIPNEF